jgi:hypothetical protein
MPVVNARPVFGHAAASLDGVRASLGLPRPASVRQLADLYVRDVVFDEPILTGDGVALGGHHTLTVRRDGIIATRVTFALRASRRMTSRC